MVSPRRGHRQRPSGMLAVVVSTSGDLSSRGVPVADRVPQRADRAALGGGSGVTWLLVAMALMPLQLEIPAFTSVVDSRFPPGDLVLAVAVLTAPALLRFRSSPPPANLPLALILTLAYGAVVAIVHAGGVTTHAILVKLVGGAVLAVWGLATINATAGGHHWRLLRVWLIAMVVSSIVAYIDWAIVDITSVIVHDVETRFGATQFDPNNAGAAYAVAVILAWRCRHLLFERTWVKLVVPGILAVTTLLTLSRGAYLALAAALIVMTVVDWPSARAWRGYLLGAVAVVALGLATGAIQDASAELAGRPDNVGSRQQLITGALDRFADSGGLGIGLGTQLAQEDKIVHNTAVWLLVEMSFVGVAFYALLVVLVASAALRIRRFAPELGVALLGAHVVMVVASLGIEGLYQRQWWLIIGLSTLTAASASRAVSQPSMGVAPPTEAAGDAPAGLSDGP